MLNCMIHLTNISFLNHGEIRRVTYATIGPSGVRTLPLAAGINVGSNQLANICMSV